MDLALDILKNDEINHLFLKANAEIVNNNIENFIATDDKQKLLLSLWRNKHNCKLDLEKNTMVFGDYKSLMAFMLKHAS